jgi:hypothetical protein
LTLLLEEPSKQGYTYKLYVSIELFGDRAEQAAETLNAGDLVLVATANCSGKAGSIAPGRSRASWWSWPGRWRGRRAQSR